jgi:hypothetical protein
MTYYTYAHYTPKGDIFYIGKGTENRAYSTRDRGYKWKEIVKKNMGISIQILANWDTEEEAFSHEQLLIDCFKGMGANLVNLTNGGRGPNGYMQSPETRKKKRDKMLGYKYKLVTCPKCGTTGGNTSIYRWHFDKCTGAKKYKARVTIDGKRMFLGNFATKDQATQVMINYYASVNKPLPKEFIKFRGKNNG